MKAMILAAGKGTRLRPLTKDKPKPMIQIADRPILEHNIRLLASNDIRDLVINLHHCPEVIKDYFGDGHQWGVSITYSYEPVLLDTAGAVKNVESLFTDTFIVFYGDNLTNCNIKQLLHFHQQKGGIGIVALFNRENPTKSGIADLNENNHITRFLEKPQSDNVFSHWVSAGIMVLEPQVFDYIPPDQPSDFGKDILPRLIKDNQALYGYRMKGDLWWIDTLEDFKRVRKIAEEGGLEVP